MNAPNPSAGGTSLRLIAAIVALTAGATAAVIAILLIHTALG